MVQIGLRRAARQRPPGGYPAAVQHRDVQATSAVEQGLGHPGKVGACKPQQIGIPRRWDLHLAQGLLNIYEALDTPDGSYKHRRTPFRLFGNEAKMR